MDLILSIFGCGTARKILVENLNKLEEDLVNNIDFVAKRVQFSQYLRYQLKYQANPFLGINWDIQTEWMDIPSLEVYLLFTCLDTLAGKSNHKDFNLYIKELDDTHKYTKKYFAEFYKQYQEKHGVTRNLQKLFDDLPIATKEWLSKNVSITKKDDPFYFKNEDTEKLIKKIFNHFYKYRRNTFTHRSETKPIFVEEDIALMKKEETGFHWPYVGSKLAYHVGIDEATILRMIIFSVIMQKLKINVTEGLLENYLFNLERINVFYNLIEEVERNTNNIGWWKKYVKGELALSGSTKNLMSSFGISKIGLNWVNRAIESFEDNGMENGLRGFFNTYLEYAEKINSNILNNKIPLPSEKEDREEFFNKNKEFLIEQINLSEWAFIVKAPNTPQYNNVWGIIRNPCYL